MNPKAISIKWQIALITFVRLVLNTMHRFIYPFLPVIARGLDVSISTLASALAIRAIVGAIGPLVSSYTDVIGRRSGILGGMIIFTAGLIPFIIHPELGWFWFALLFTAFGKTIFDPSVQAHIGDQVPYEKRGLAIAMTEFGWSLSFIIGVPVIGLIINSFNWYTPFPLIAVFAVLGTLLIYYFLPNSKRDDANKNSVFQNFLYAVSKRAVIAGALLGLFISAANEVVNIIFGVYLESNFGLQVLALSGATLIIGVAEFGGEGLVGLVSDRLGKHKSIRIGLFINALAAIAISLFTTSLIGTTASFFVFYLSFEFTLVSSIPLMTEVSPAARATTLAIFVAGVSLGRALGAFISPPLFVQGIIYSALAVIVLNAFGYISLRFVTTKQTS